MSKKKLTKDTALRLARKVAKDGTVSGEMSRTGMTLKYVGSVRWHRFVAGGKEETAGWWFGFVAKESAGNGSRSGFYMVTVRVSREGDTYKVLR